MSPKPLPPRQSKFRHFALQHPVWLTLASGLVMFLWAANVVGDWRAQLAASVVTVLLVGILWSPKGWARRREQRLYDDNGDRREQNRLP